MAILVIPTLFVLELPANALHLLARPSLAPRGRRLLKLMERLCNLCVCIDTAPNEAYKQSEGIPMVINKISKRHGPQKSHEDLSQANAMRHGQFLHHCGIPLGRTGEKQAGRTRVMVQGSRWLREPFKVAMEGILTGERSRGCGMESMEQVKGAYQIMEDAEMMGDVVVLI